MCNIISKISLTLLSAFAVAMPVFAAPESPSAKESLPAGDGTPAATDPAAELLEARSVIADNELLISQLKQELSKEKLKVTNLNKKVETLNTVVSAAMPLAEEATANIVDMNADLAKADVASINKSLATLKLLSLYSAAIASQYDNVDKYCFIVKTYQENLNFDTKPYSEKDANDYEDKTLEIFDLADNFLSTAQVDSINNLYRKIRRYESAVEAFDNLIGNMDAQLEPSRDIEAGDMICKNDREMVLSSDESKALIKELKNYRYLAGLYDSYIDELQKKPRSRTESVRAEIAAMLGKPSATAENGDASNNISDGDKAGKTASDGDINDDEDTDSSDDTPDVPSSQEF